MGRGGSMPKYPPRKVEPISGHLTPEDLEAEARRLEGRARFELPDEARKSRDLARGIREGAVVPCSDVWRHHLGQKPSAAWIVAHRAAQAWIRRCAEERGERPPACEACRGRYCDEQ